MKWFMVKTVVEFSIVCPIKEEVQLIPQTLPSFYSLNPSEVILCLDKPVPKEVLEVISKVAEAYNAEKRTRIIEVERNSEWAFHQAWVRRRGFLEAKHDYILTTDIDIIINPEIKQYFNLVGKNKIRLVSFSKFPYPVAFRKMIEWLMQSVKFYYHPRFTGLYFFSKSAWQETEDFESLKELLRGEDTHLHEAITKKYDAVFIGSIKNILLRPGESKKYHYLAGWERWKTRKVPFWRVLFSALFHFRPYMLAGYLKARFVKSNEPL